MNPALSQVPSEVPARGSRGKAPQPLGSATCSEEL